MKIAFVFAPYTHKRFSENLTIVDEDFGVFPPINLAWAAAIAEEAGHNVIVVDAMAERLTKAQTIDRLRSFGAELVGFYFSTYMFHDTLAWARAIKGALGVPVIAGGINVDLYPEETMAYRDIDFALAGQAYGTLPAMLEAIEAGKEPSSIPGACWRRGDEIIINEPDRRARAFAKYPLPARHLLPNDRYYSITSQLKNFTIMVTAMGCYQHCSFCPIARIPYQLRPVDAVLDEMEECVKRYGIREIDIFDADFPAPRARTEAICDGILERGLKFEWSCRACVDSLDRELLKKMGDAGCRKVYIGIETPNKRHLQEMKKKLDPSRTKQVIKDALDVGIRPLGFFMLGVPGETKETIAQTVFYSLTLGLEYAQYMMTIAKPGTELHQQIIQATGHDPWRDWVLGLRGEERLPTPWTSLSQEEIEIWGRVAYLLFYYRPWYIAKAIRRFRSLEEVLRSARSAARMLANVAFGERLVRYIGRNKLPEI